MNISFSFYSLKNLSVLSHGERFLEILSLHGIIIDKAGEYEPIKKDFSASDISEVWPHTRCGKKYSSGYFLFKGKQEIRFSGMVTWYLNIHPNSKTFEGVNLHLNIPKKYNYNRLVRLGDDLFVWCDGVYGYITEESKSPHNIKSYEWLPNKAKPGPGNPYTGLPGLAWVNYFGSPYLLKTNFHTPNTHVPIGHGMRVMLSETPDDEKLSDKEFLEICKNNIGIEWFWSNPRNPNMKIPGFDKSEIIQQ